MTDGYCTRRLTDEVCGGSVTMRRLPRRRDGMNGYDEPDAVYDCDYCGRIDEDEVEDCQLDEEDDTDV